MSDCCPRLLPPLQKDLVLTKQQVETLNSQLATLSAQVRGCI